MTMPKREMWPFWRYKAEIWFTSHNIASPLFPKSAYLAVDCKVCRKNICFMWCPPNGKVIHNIQSINGTIHTLLFFFFLAGPFGLGQLLSWVGAAGVGIFSFPGSCKGYSSNNCLNTSSDDSHTKFGAQLFNETLTVEFFDFQSISEQMSIFSSRGEGKYNWNMMGNSKAHIKGIIVDNRLIWKQLVTGLDFYVGVEVFPSNIITKNKVPSLRIIMSQIFGWKEQ